MSQLGVTSSHGAVAAGHTATADAAAEILQDGGNAVDAALAAMCAACVAEPVLASLGGGGFLNSRLADGTASVFDFFAHTPQQRKPEGEGDFHPIVADFGATTQEFHIGLASMAVPGAVAGLFDAHAAHGRLPMARLVAPAIRLAREGVTVNRFQAYIFDVVAAIYQSTADCRAQYGSPTSQGELVREGDMQRVPHLADTFDALAREGAGLFYQGEIADKLVRDCRDGGGLLTRGDLASYQVFRRAPLALRYKSAQIETNPPPSSGGLLIAFGLEMLRDIAMASDGFGSAAHMRGLLGAMAATNAARRESGLHDVDEAAAAGLLLSPDLLARYRALAAEYPPSYRGTTHISVVDRDGNAAALTLSNGEGAGYIIPGTGIVMNNMLGEEDINPHGFHQWPENKRMSSMMAPTVLTMDDGRLIALGSGGSNRIRTAILQMLVNVVDLGLPLADAVTRSRLHLENGRLGLEPGFEALDAVIDAAGADVDVHHWPEQNLFFGGVHAVSFNAASGAFEAAGDPRRGGVGHIV